MKSERLNCVLHGANQVDSDRLIAYLNRHSSRFRLLGNINDVQLNDTSELGIVFFLPDPDSLRDLITMVRVKAHFIPVIYLDSVGILQTMAAAAALEWLDLSLGGSHLVKLERTLIDLIDLGARSASFADGMEVSLNFLLQHMESGVDSKIVLPDINGYFEVNKADVLKLEKEGPYTLVYLFDGKCITACKPIEHFFGILRESNFYRLNNECIVNSTGVVRWSSGTPIRAIICDGTEISVALRSLPLYIDIIAQSGK